MQKHCISAKIYLSVC